ncbi:MAG TPA: transglycosylase family protein [Solirubrobacterales bacterium]|nr:transglycosylase family protein [Solirubrobacterales bacterium]
MKFETDSPIPSARIAGRGRHGRLRVAGVAAAVGALLALGAVAAQADSISDLNAKIASAQSQAQSLSASVQAKADQVAAAQQQAAAAAQREAELSGLLAQGQQRSAELGVKVDKTHAHLQRARSHLHRALAALEARLVAIYKGNAPDVTVLLLSSRGFDDLANRAELVGRIEKADADLAARVRKLRNEVKDALAAVRQAKAQQDAYNARVAEARDQIAAVRANAEQQAAQLEAARQQEAAAIATLQSNVSTWESQVQEIQAAQAAAAQEAEQASAASAQQTVASWVGDWAIPEAIVMCESGGNFNAVNPSSGAGGAYQILPSTWELYGGSGAPQDASPSEQSQIASQIWAASGSSAWVCAQ